MNKSKALSQGYTQYGYNELGYQSLYDISEFTEKDEQHSEGSFAVIAEKEFTVPSISSEEIKDLIADHVCGNWEEETGCDNTIDLSSAINKIDFSAITQTINEAIHGGVISYTKLTTIRLTEF